MVTQMSDYTFASVLISAADRQQAQADLGDGFFNTPLSPTGEAPATNFMSSGPFDNSELNIVVNTAIWPKRVYFGQDWQAAISAEGLQMMAVESPA